jgi:hypothetical protein
MILVEILARDNMNVNILKLPTYMHITTGFRGFAECLGFAECNTPQRALGKDVFAECQKALGKEKHSAKYKSEKI